jgi:hypothetical protein
VNVIESLRRALDLLHEDSYLVRGLANSIAVHAAKEAGYSEEKFIEQIRNAWRAGDIPCPPDDEMVTLDVILDDGAQRTVVGDRGMLAAGRAVRQREKDQRRERWKR